MDNPDNKPVPARRALTDRNKIFLDKLSDGVNPVDAYRLAGYTGSPHTAYELKRQLKQELRQYLESKGFTLEGVASEILQLSRLPVDLTKYPNGIPLSQKLQILRLFAQTVKDDVSSRQAPTPHVTAFIISRAPGGSAHAGPGHVDTSAVPSDEVKPQ